MLILQCKKCNSIIHEISVVTSTTYRSDMTVSIPGNCIIENDREYFGSEVESVIFHCMNCGSICISSNSDPYVDDFIRDGKVSMQDLTKSSYGKRIKVIKKYTTIKQMYKKLKQLLRHI